MSFSEYNKNVFDAHAGEYAHARYWREDEEVLVNRYFTDTSATMLVAGVGGGRVLEPLLQRGYTITAVDIAPHMVEETKAEFGERVEVLEMDIQRTTFGDASFTYIFLPFHTVCYVDDIDATLRELRRLVQPGGVVIINATNHTSIKSLLDGSVFKGKDRPVRMHRTDGSDSVLTHHLSFLDGARFRKIFPHVEVFGRSQLHTSPPPNWKESVLRMMPWLDKSLYFVLRP